MIYALSQSFVSDTLLACKASIKRGLGSRTKFSLKDYDEGMGIPRMWNRGMARTVRMLDRKCCKLRIKVTRVDLVFEV